MPFASGAFGQLRYIVESVPGQTPTTGNGVNLRQTGTSMKASVATIRSQEIAAHRMSTDQTQSDLDIDGGFNFELSALEYDPFIEGVLDSTFTHYGTNGFGTSFAAVTTASTITASAAPTGSSAFTTLPQGSWFKLVAPPAATQAQKDYFADRWFKVSSATAPTPTVITLDPSTPISGVGIIGTALAGFSVTASRIQNAAGLNRHFTLEYAMTDINQFLPFRGMRANALELSIDVGAIITGSFGFIGRGHDGMVGATTLPGSPVASKDKDVMNAVADVGLIYENGSSILSGGSSFIKSAKLNFSNGLRGQKAIGVYGNAGVGTGELEITGSLEIYVEDATYYNKWLKGTVTNLALGMADAEGNGYLVEMERVKFSDGGLNLGGKSEDAMLSLPFSAFYSAATGRGIRVTRAVAA